MLFLALLSYAVLSTSHVIKRGDRSHYGSNGTRTSTIHGTGRRPASASDVLKIIDAIGGRDALKGVRGLSLNGGNIYRSATLSQTYDLNSLDQSVATGGSSSWSFSFQNHGLLSRIDRAYAYDDYWVWEVPTLQPLVNMSLVINDAEEQYACFVKGSNNFLTQFSSVQGYTDGLVTGYLVHQARQFALPWLLQTFLTNSSSLETYQVRERYSAAVYDVIEHTGLGLSVLSNTTTGLPHAVRSVEDHVIYGRSTSDLIFTNWQPTTVTSGLNITLPLRMQTVYNSRFVIEDNVLDSVSINPAFPHGFFEGRAPEPDPQNIVQLLAPQKPRTSPEYGLAEIHEFYEAGIWSGDFSEQYNTSDIVLEYPDPSFKNILKIYVGYVDYVQLLIEHEGGFIITDATPHRSKVILEWLQATRPDKRITHVVPTHHHSDHADGVIDYVNAGAKLVVPAIANDYWRQVFKQSSIITYNDQKPFVLKDKVIDFRSYWSHDNPHAEDQAFPVVTKANATDADLFVLYEADVVNPGSAAIYYKSLYAWDMLVRSQNIGLPRSTLVVSAHVHGANTTGVSSSQPLAEIGDSVGFTYPDLKMSDWYACVARGCKM